MELLVLWIVGAAVAGLIACSKDKGNRWSLVHRSARIAEPS